MTDDAVEEAPLAQFKSALTLSLEEEGLELYEDLVEEVAAETGKDPKTVAAAAARLARRAQEPDALEKIAGYELEQAQPGTRASRRGPSYDSNADGYGDRGTFTPRGGGRRRAG